MSDFSQYAYRHASGIGQQARMAGSNTGIDSEAIEMFHSRIFSFDGSRLNSGIKVKDGLRSEQRHSSQAGGSLDPHSPNGTGEDIGRGVTETLLDSLGGNGIDSTVPLGGGSGGLLRSARGQSREEEFEQLRKDTQNTRLAGSNSLLTLPSWRANGRRVCGSACRRLPSRRSQPWKTFGLPRR